MVVGELLLTTCRGAGGTSSPPSSPPVSSSCSPCCLHVFHLEWALFRPDCGERWAKDKVEEDGGVGWGVAVGVGVDVGVALDGAGLYLSNFFSGFT